MRTLKSFCDSKFIRIFVSVMVNVILTIALILIPIVLIGASIFNLISSIKSSRITSSYISSWSKFNKEITEWGEEITDESIKRKYYEHCISILTEEDKNRSMSDYQRFILDKNKIPELRSEIYKLFSSHIPSIRREVRDHKLSKILK